MWDDIQALIVLAFGPAAVFIGAVTLGSLVVLYVAVAVLRLFQGMRAK